MGLTSEYLKFHPVGVFGLVTSSRCPPVYLSSRLVACGCNENVLVWNIATGLRSALLRGESSQGKDLFDFKLLFHSCLFKRNI